MLAIEHLASASGRNPDLAHTVIWLCGQPAHDLQPAADWLYSQNFSLTEPFSSAAEPAAVVLFQNRPGEFRQSELEAIHRRAPLARLILLTGPLCAGELRSGKPLVGVERLSWLTWRDHLPLLLKPAATRPPQARTLAPADTILRDCSLESTPQLDLGQSAIVYSRSASIADAVCQLLQTLGYHAAWANNPAEKITHLGASALILVEGDAVPCLADSVSLLGEGKKIWLRAFARPEEAKQALAAGYHAVLPLPLLRSDLQAVLTS